jgi:hypothetical protein
MPLCTFGKSELAKLNPFDLVDLLSLSNTVQSAIIGGDNFITGGVIGAVGLLAVNWLVVPTLFRSPRLTREELVDAIHRQGFDELHAERRCELEPNGTFYIEVVETSLAERRHIGVDGQNRRADQRDQSAQARRSLVKSGAATADSLAINVESA